MLSQKVEEVLSHLQKALILDQLVLIGSWCMVFYREYYQGDGYFPAVRTLDVDFLIPHLRGKQKIADVSAVLEGLDFRIDFTASGWVRFQHPDLRVEFLVPLLGPKSDEPVTVEKYNVSAQPIRHISILAKHTIAISYQNFLVTLPHPIAFALHKIFISQRRKEKGKAVRDLEAALALLKVIQTKHSKNEWLKVWRDFSKNEQKVIREVLGQQGDGKEILEFLK